MTEQLRIPLTAAQKQLIMDAAAANGSEMTAWARALVLKVASEHAGKQPKPRKH